MLEGLHVLDCCDERGQLAGRILGDLGADVVLIEPPGGDALRRHGPFHDGSPELDRSLPWWALNTSKRSLVLDLASEDGRRELHALAARSDVLLETAAPGERAALGLDRGELQRLNPRLVHCSITPFGSDGPRAAEPGHDLVVVASGGNAWMTGDPERTPLRCTLPTAYLHGGPEAVIGVLLALLAREETGCGQHVDLSLQECQLGTLLSGPGQRALGGPPGRRTGARLGRTREIWAARDGWISFGLRGGPARIPNLIATVEYMAECDAAPAWLREYDWSQWNPARASAEEIARVEDAFAAFFATRSLRELYEQALARRILLAPCNDGREVLAHPQLRARGLFQPLAEPAAGVTLEHPAFFARWQSEGGGEIRVRARAPRLAEHGEAALAESRVRQPLAPVPALRPGPLPGLLRGLRVLELGSGAAGPVVTKYFAEHGADVLRIESRGRPDFLRFLQPDGPAGLDRSPMFALLNPDKRSVTLDMRQERAREILQRLVLEWADVVSENFAPGVLERWGIDLGALRARKPALVVVRSCLFGQTGPQRHYPGFGGQGAAIAGFNHLTGEPDGEAIGPYATITDSLSPRYAAAAVLAALWRVRRGAPGGSLDVSQIETGVYSLAEMVVRASAGAEPARRLGNRHECAAPHGIFRCRGDRERWVAIAVLDDEAWQRLAAELVRDGLACDPAWSRAAARLADVAALETLVSSWTRDREQEAVVARLRAVGVEVAAVQNFDDLLRDPQLAHRGHFVPVPHPELGELLCERAGYRLAACPGTFHRGGPRLGEHTREVLASALALSDDEIDALEREGVLR